MSESVLAFEEAWERRQRSFVLTAIVYRWFCLKRVWPEMLRLAPLVVVSGVLLTIIILLLREMVPVAWKNYELRMHNRELSHQVNMMKMYEWRGEHQIREIRQLKATLQSERQEKAKLKEGYLAEASARRDAELARDDALTRLGELELAPRKPTNQPIKKPVRKKR
jgi:hypothetical protein